MRDVEIRGKLLKIFYERRHNAGGWVPISDVNLAGGEVVDPQVIEAICGQLADAELIHWRPLKRPQESFTIGAGKITATGVDVIEGSAPSPIAITSIVETPVSGRSFNIDTNSAAGRVTLPTKRRELLKWAGGAHVTFAIAFTDMVDSTALNIELGDAAMSKIRRNHFAQSANFLSQHDGFEVKTIGDGILSVFRSVSDALAYAVALHGDPGASELKVRAGIHIGPIEVTEHDIEGAEVAIASRVVGAIAGAEIWMSSRAKDDIDRFGSYRNQGWHWQPHDVFLKGVGTTRLWSLTEESSSGGEAYSNRPPEAEDQRTVAARRYFAPELARVIRQQIYILGRAVPNFVMTSVGKPPPGDRWTTLRPAQPQLYPSAPEFANLSADDATLLNEFYNLVQEITDIVSGWIENEPPPPPVNAWNFLMQKVRHSLEVGKIAAQRFCPDRQFDATMPASGTLIARTDAAIASVKPVLDAHLARHATNAPAPAPGATRRARQPLVGERPNPLPRGPNSWMAR